MTKESIIDDVSGLLKIAKKYHSSIEDRELVARFVSAGKEVLLPHEDDNIDLATSIIVIESKEITADLLVCEKIGELGQISRDGHRSPYISGPSLKLQSDTVTNPLLQRAGCIPVTRAAAVQFALQVLLSIPKDIDKLERQDEEALSKLWGWKKKLNGEFTNKLEVPDEVRNAVKSWLFGEKDALVGFEDKTLDSFIIGVLAKADPSRPSTSHELETEDFGRVCQQAVNVVRNDEVRHLCKERANRLRGDITKCLPHMIFQGAGDLSFNPYHVALHHGNSGKEPPKTVLPEGEPYSQRRYRCLVHWKNGPPATIGVDWLSRSGMGATLGNNLAMLELEFAPGRVFLPGREGEPRKELTDHVEFAISGKSLIWDRKLVQKDKVAEEYRDLRHLFVLPNLVYKEQGRSTEDRNTNERGTHFFGRKQVGNFWLLEAALLANRERLRLACTSSIVVPLEELGAEKELIHQRLEATGYRDKRRATEVDEPGDFCWEGRLEEDLRIFLLPNTYPCSVVGIGRRDPNSISPDALYTMAWGHGFERGRFRIWEDCARVLGAIGVEYALVMDEGEDVFQAYLNPKNLNALLDAEASGSRDLNKFMTVPFAHDVDEGRLYKRTGLRASLSFCVYDEPEGNGSK